MTFSWKHSHVQSLTMLTRHVEHQSRFGIKSLCGKCGVTLPYPAPIVGARCFRCLQTAD